MLVMKYSGLPRRLSGSCLTAYIGQGPFFHVKVKVKFYLMGEIVYCHKLSKKTSTGIVRIMFTVIALGPVTC